MSNNQISIDPKALQLQAASIRLLNNQLNEKLIDIEKTINRIKAEWDSPSGKEFSASFDKILPDFKNSTKFINKYANYLGLAAEAYEDTEKRIAKGASSFES
ncbi:MAG: WXG100 family type VII secretion target [Ruminococcaceae bacterium]|nr:WXG100 family type VII secretion target [Oscillospiraceae bacterium]